MKFWKSSLLPCRSNRRLWPGSSENGEDEEDTTRLLGIHLPDMEIVGAIEFKMDKKSYRMIPLANSEDYLYNRQSLTKAKEVGVVFGALIIIIIIIIIYFDFILFM